MKKGKLIIICGLPGSGKTTLAKKLANELSAVRFCPDEWMSELNIDLYDEDKRTKIELLHWQTAKQVLSGNGIAIIEWGTWAASERNKLRTEAKKLNAAVELHYFSVPPEELFRRIQERNMEFPPIKEEMVKQWCKSFQIPSDKELSLFDSHTHHEFIIGTGSERG